MKKNQKIQIFMKICPYCKQPIEEDYPYCPNCNKPLISNLKKSMIRDIDSKFIEEEFFSIDTIEEDGYYEDIIIEDDKIEQEIKEIISAVFKIPFKEININMTAADVEKWDSLGQLELIITVESKFGIRLEVEDIFYITTVGSIIEIVSRKVST